MIRLNKKRVVEYFWLIPLLVWAVFFFLLSHKSMILMGDTMEYFDMARQLNDGVFPKSDKWMPLYPFMIWITSKIFVVNLMVGSKIYHFLLSSIFVLLYNIFFVNEYAEKIYEKLILNAPIFCFPLFLKFSVTWMAEFQFVFLTCLVLFHLFEIVKSSQIIHVFWASIFVLLCIFTKYNGFVNLILLIMVIWYRYPPKMSMILSSVLLSLMALTYGLWLYFKPGGEFLVGGINDLITSEILIKTFLISSCDFFITISKYYTPYRIQEILQNSLNQYVAGFLFLLTILVLAIITLKSINRRNFGMTHILISYILLYITLFFLRGIPSARSEVNERTLLTILVLGSVLFSMYLIKRKINYFSFFFYLIIIVGLLKVPIFLNKMYIIGEGRLSETKFAPQSGLIQKFMLINGSCNISNSMIFSNQDRVLGMYNNYNKITPLPTSKIFKGNSYGDNLKKFQTDSIQFMEVINKNRAWMVVFYYIDEKRERFDSKSKHLVSELFKDSRNNVFKNEDGIIIWPK